MNTAAIRLGYKVAKGERSTYSGSLALLVRDIGFSHGEAWQDAVEYVVNTFGGRGWRNLEDKLQQALAKAMVTWDSDKTASPKTYLVKAFLWANGNEKAYNGRKRREHTETSLNAVIDETEGETLESVLADPNQPEVWDSVSRSEETSQVESLLSVLSQDEKDVIMLRSVEGLKFREIAGKLGVTLQRVEQIEKKAQRKLRGARGMVNKVSELVNRSTYPARSHETTPEVEPALV